MPIYEYACSACRHRTEVLHGIDGTGPAVCPSCGAEGTMRKTFAAPAIVFKGSGWAKRDRRSAPAASSSTSGSGDAGSGDGSDGSGRSGASSDGAATTAGDAKGAAGSGKAAAKAAKDPAPTSGTTASD